MSSGVQTLLILMIALNLTVGLALTYDWREWPHRLQEIFLYVIFLCEWRWPIVLKCLFFFCTHIISFFAHMALFVLHACRFV